MEPLEVMKWVLGGTMTAQFFILGLVFKMMKDEKTARERADSRIEGKLDDKLESQDSRLRDSPSHQQVEQLIDLKIQPLKDSLDRNTAAVTHLTQVLVNQGVGTSR